MVIRIDYKDGYYYAYYYDIHISTQKSLLAATKAVYKYIKGQGDKR